MSNQVSDDRSAERSVVPTVVSFRFRKAFPELTGCFDVLTRLISSGFDWLAAIRAHAGKIGDERKRLLLQEIDDAVSMGLKTDHDLDTLVSVLGWDGKHFAKLVPIPKKVPEDTLTMLSELAAGVEDAWPSPLR
jgi:hypothetical protein